LARTRHKTAEEFSISVFVVKGKSSGETKQNRRLRLLATTSMNARLEVIVSGKLLWTSA